MTLSARPRVAIAGFDHESNSFAPFAATYANFRDANGWPALTKGADLLETFAPLNIPIGGFINAASGFDLAPALWTSAEPCGPVEDEAFDRITGMICDSFAAAGHLDAVYLDLHGAMVTATYEDAEGEILRRVRATVGNEIPVVVSLDMHANITQAMVDRSDAITIFRTYPHIDPAATGARCCALLERRLALGLPFRKAFRKLPFLIPLSAQSTDTEPFRTTYGALQDMQTAEVLSVDLGAGFPPSDIADCGPAVVAYGIDQQATDAAADALYHQVLDAESRFVNPLLTPELAIECAIKAAGPGRPALLADVQDNPGCGGTSDTVSLIQALAKTDVKRVAVGIVWDPPAADAAHEAGLGAELHLTIGGRFGYDASPFTGTFKVEALSDGRIPGTGVIQKGIVMSLGRMTQLRLLGAPCDLRIVVSSVRYQCLDQNLFRALGVEPLDQTILALKSTVHFRADFAPIASAIFLVEAPGAAPCRSSVLPYRRLRAGVRLQVGDAPAGLHGSQTSRS